MTGPLDIPHIIPTIRRFEEWEELASWDESPRWAFILGGAFDEVAQATGLLQKRGWQVFVHIDMIRGCATDAEGVRFFAEYAGPDGIISTHSAVIGHAKKVRLKTIQRIFLLDSQSVATGVQQVQATRPDAVETLPGTLSEVTGRVVRQIPCPVIAGGLVSSAAEVTRMLDVGVRGISTSNRGLWALPKPARRGGQK